MLKCSNERWVCAPHSLSAGTSTTPRLSLSFLKSVMCSLLACGLWIAVRRNWQGCNCADAGLYFAKLEDAYTDPRRRVPPINARRASITLRQGHTGIYSTLDCATTLTWIPGNWSLSVVRRC